MNEIFIILIVIWVILSFPFEIKLLKSYYAMLKERQKRQSEYLLKKLEILEEELKRKEEEKK